MSTHQLRSILAFALGFASLAIVLTKVQSLPTPPPAPPPPGHPTPGHPIPGHPTPGGTYVSLPSPPQGRLIQESVGHHGRCEHKPKVLNALIPEKKLESPEPLKIGQGLTTSQYPTFWVYVPYAPEDRSVGVFLLHDRQEHTLYYTYLNLSKTPGIISIELPSNQKYALEEGKFYHWYFALQCQGNTIYESDLTVDGWVKRVALTPDRDRQINTAKPDIWYDSLTRLAKLRLTSPQDDKLKSDWNNLLKSVGLEDLVQEQLIGSAH